MISDHSYLLYVVENLLLNAVETLIHLSLLPLPALELA